MNLYTDRVSLISIVAFGALLFFILVLLRPLTKRLGNSVAERLPRPFLGEGANVEWAAIKRAELEADAMASASGTQHGYGSDSWPDIASAKGSFRVAAKQDSDDAHRDILAPESSLIENQETLLQDWMTSGDHNDDEWAAKLLSEVNNAK